MFWDQVAFVYDVFENIYNRRVYNQTGVAVSQLLKKEDQVLECACGTGAISVHMAEKCRHLVATDFSEKMLQRAKKKLKKVKNVDFEQADITHLKYNGHSFDVVVAGNVIHLLPNPKHAMKELERVCKRDGKLIIPTYINESETSSRLAVRFLVKLGVDFKRQFDEKSYKKFFADMGYTDVNFYTVQGRMPCCIAIIELSKQNEIYS